MFFGNDGVGFEEAFFEGVEGCALEGEVYRRGVD